MNGNRNFRYFTYIEPVLRNPLIRTYGYIIFTIIMTTIFIIFAIKPTLETIVVLQKQLSDQKEILSKLSQKTDALTEARTNFQSIPQDQKIKLELAVPRKLDLPILINFLESSTLSTQASISALQFQPILVERPTGQNLAEVPFTFNVEATYPELKLILQNLYHSTRIITIDSLTFNKVESGNTVLMSISGKSYYLK